MLVSTSDKALLCDGNKSRVHCPTDVAGVVALLLTIRGYSLGRSIMFARAKAHSVD